MDLLPYEIMQLIILNISSCTTKDASHVCCKWKKIFDDNFLTINDKKIIVNDTFILTKTLNNFNLSIKLVGRLLDENTIYEIRNPKCLTYIAKFLIPLKYRHQYYELILEQLCANDNLIAIKFYEKFNNRHNFASVDPYGRILLLSLKYNSFKLIDYLVKETTNIDLWIEYIIFNSYNEKVIISLDYLVSIKAINLHYLHNELKNSHIGNYIKEKYF